MGVEIAAGQNGRLERGEEAGTYPHKPRVLVRGVRTDNQAPHAASNQEMGSSSGGFYLRCGAYLGEQLVQHGFIVVLFVQVKSRLEDTLRAEAKVHRDEP